MNRTILSRKDQKMIYVRYTPNGNHSQARNKTVELNRESDRERCMLIGLRKEGRAPKKMDTEKQWKRFKRKIGTYQCTVGR